VNRAPRFLSLFSRLWPTSLRRQLILGVALVHLCLMMVFVVDIVTRQRLFLRNEDIDQVRSMAKFLAINSSSWVLAHDMVGLEEILHPLSGFPDLRYAMIVTPDGKILAHTDVRRTGLYLKDAASRALLQSSPEIRIVFSGEQLIDVAAPIMSVGECIGWVRVGIGQEKNARNLRQVTRDGIGYTLLAILAGTLFAWILGNRLTSRLNRLLAIAGEIRQGNREVRAEVTPDEVGRLGDGFNRMLDVVCDQEQRVRLLLDSTAEGIYGTDMAGNCTFCNPAALTLLGYADGSALLDRNIHEMVHHHREDGSRCHLEECRIFRSQESTTGVHSDEEIFWRADRSWFRVEYWAYPIMKDGARIGTVVTFMDITRRKELEFRLREYSENLELLVGQRTEELEGANRELQQRRDEAEQANRAKSDFLANMSHELRTPLTAVIGFSEILQDQLFGELNERQLLYVEAIQTSGHHLLRLINDVLDLAKVESGKYVLELRRFSLGEHLGNVVLVLREKAHRQGITLKLQVADGIELEADETKLKQIFYNLIGNALKFTPEGGTVTISADRGANENTIQICVEDTGIGIKAEDLPRLFQKFTQLESAISKKYEGTGLGLALTKSLVELHGGAIGVESEPGRGSRFTVTLPVRREPAAAVGDDSGANQQHTR
jgi:PAS domain S-box-containing protein